MTKLFADIDPAPVFRDARYAKGMVAVHCPPNGTGWKTRAAHICDSLNARYSGREDAYIMSEAKAGKVCRAFVLGRYSGKDRAESWETHPA